MGLFSKDKKKMEFPKLPELPRFESSVQKYEPTLSDIKKEVEVENLDEELGFPQRKFEIPERKPIFVEKHIITRPPVEDGKPIFVKIENYKEALDVLDEIKNKLNEAEKIFSDLERLKDEQDKNFDSWKADLYKIKERIMNVDKKLFEL